VFARSSCPPITAEEATCRYDKWQRPLPVHEGPTKVHAKVHVYFLGAIEAQSLVGQTVKVQHLSLSNNTKKCCAEMGMLNEFTQKRSASL
jgi:hypothetical protein